MAKHEMYRAATVPLLMLLSVLMPKHQGSVDKSGTHIHVPKTTLICRAWKTQRLFSIHAGMLLLMHKRPLSLKMSYRALPVIQPYMQVLPCQSKSC